MAASRHLLAALALSAALPAAALAQNRALTQADWDRWRSISGAAITPDGQWAVYSISPLVGDGELVIRSTTGPTEFRVPRGYTGRPNNVPGGLRPRSGGNPEEEPSGPGIAPAQVTADGRYALALTYPARAEFDRAARDRRRTTQLQGQSTLAIVRIADGTVTSIPRVRSFRLPRLSGAWLAYSGGDTVPAVQPGADSAARPAARPAGDSATATGGARRRYGSPLTLRRMSDGTESRIADVLDWTFDDSARVLVYTVVSRDSTKDGAYVRDLASGATRTLMAGRGDYTQVAINRTATQVAFLANRDAFGAAKAEDRRYSLYHATLREGAARPAVMAASLDTMRIPASSNVAFTRSGSAIVFGVAPPPMDTLPADPTGSRANFDLWHWKDPQLQPTQALNANRDRNRTFQTIHHIGTRRTVRLASDSIANVQLSDDGRIGVANARERYAISSMWGDAGTDVYVIDATTGAARLLVEKISGGAQLSPDARYVTYYNDGKWFAHALATGRTVEITAPVKGVSFARETHDTPSPAPGWGIAGWTRGDRSVLVYDRYDIWELDPAGTRAPVMLTDSVGRRTSTTLRLAMANGGQPAAEGDEERGLDPARPIMLKGVNEETKAQTFVREWIAAGRPAERLVAADAAFGPPIKARDADRWLITRGTFVNYPDLHTGTTLAQLTRISDVNPQQREYNWGTRELVTWHSADGVPLKGILTKPGDFDPSKKYPMIVYHYEDLSQNLHNYVPPNGRNVTNATHYASNGYLVFEPDIHYEEGYPGPSALKSIVPGVNMLLARGYVDPKGIGIQGQSWGGYQGLYMITQSHIFSAAMLGAPVVNMTSAYGGIRWGSGVARAFQYETGQSRIGASLWEAPMRYVENSPLFWLDKVRTPVFFMHNDADDAVPWEQGIEAFVALRRLGKEVYLINYNNDVHNPASRANQKDMAMRMQQFFDHKLKGAPAPAWMTKGVPYLAKGRDQVPVEQAGTPTP